MTPALVIVTTNGRDGEEFKAEINKNYPNVKIEWQKEEPAFNDYLIIVPSKAMAKRMMCDLGRTKSLAMHWVRKFHRFVDSDTGEEAKLYSYFFYRTKEQRKIIDLRRENAKGE